MAQLSVRMREDIKKRLRRATKNPPTMRELVERACADWLADHESKLDGPPSKKSKASRKRLQIEIDDDVHRRIKEEAKRRADQDPPMKPSTMQDLVDIAVEEYLRHMPNYFSN